MVAGLGWAATGVFVASYFCGAGALRRLQMLGAGMWMAYGVFLHAPPVVVANLLVLCAAAWSATRSPTTSDGSGRRSAVNGHRRRRT